MLLIFHASVSCWVLAALAAAILGVLLTRGLRVADLTTRATWAATAEALGGCFEPVGLGSLGGPGTLFVNVGLVLERVGPGRQGAASLTDDREIRLDRTVHYHHQGFALDVLRARVSLPQAKSFRAFTGNRLWWRFQNPHAPPLVITGDRAYDKKFVLSTAHERWVLDRFDAEARRLHLALPEARIRLEDGELCLEYFRDGRDEREQSRELLLFAARLSRALC